MCLAFMNILLWTDMSVCVLCVPKIRLPPGFLCNGETLLRNPRRPLAVCRVAELPSVLFIFRTSLSMALGPATDGSASLQLHHSIYIFMSHFYFVLSHSQPRPPFRRHRNKMFY